jgi:hypothetical protein
MSEGGLFTPSHPSSIKMATWSVYFDDSGTHAQSAIAVAACYIAPAPQWRKFIRAWSNVSDRESFRIFHMADFNARQGEFKGWEEDKRNRVIRKLIGIIRQYTTQGFAVALPKSDYDAVMPADLKVKMGIHPYSWCVKLCFGQIEKWRKKCSLTAPMQYVFESGTKGTGELINTLTKYAKHSRTLSRDTAWNLMGFRSRKKKTRCSCRQQTFWRGKLATR